MYFNLFLSKTTNNKQMYSPILYKYQDSLLLLTPTVQLFGSLLQTHIFLYRHTHMTFPSPGQIKKIGGL